MKKILFGLAIAGLFASCNGGTAKVTVGNTPDAKIEQNKATALASTNAMIKHDIDGSFKDYAPDFKDLGNGSTPPMSIDSVKANTKKFLTAFPDFKGDSLIVTGDSSRVIVTGKYSGTFTNDFMGMTATKKAFHVADADIYTFNDKGQITSHQNIQGDGTFMFQLGVLTMVKK